MWPFGPSKTKQLKWVLRNQEAIVSALSELTDAVRGMSESIDAAVTALGSRPADNSAELAALTAELTSAKGKLDTAVAAATAPVT